MFLTARVWRGHGTAPSTGVEMQFAVQVQWPGGDWLYVVGQDEKPMTFDEKSDAEVLAELWRKPEYPDAVRVVEFTR